MYNTYNAVQEINISIFKNINHLFGRDQFDTIMTIIDTLGEAKKMYFHFSIIIAIGLSIFFYHRKNEEVFKRVFTPWLASIATALISMLSLGIAFILKNYTEINRPFCSLAEIHTIKHITDNLDCNHSFPSGHIIFTTVLATSFWPILTRLFKLFFISFIILTAITRIASGAHYPVDLLGGLVISLPLSLYIKIKIYDLSTSIENKYNLSKIIQNILIKYS